MTLLLSSERSVTAASRFRPFANARKWFVTLRKQQARQRALNSLLAMEDHRLHDLGLTREAIQTSLETGAPLNRTRFLG